MTIELTSFPNVPPQRNALTSADIRSYITSPAWANFSAIETLLESLEAAINALPTTVSSASMPDSAILYDRWIDESSGDQEKVCINPYTSGSGLAGDWVSLRDAATLTLATSAYNTAIASTNSSASDFPVAYTQDWIFVNSSTGAMYMCNETYTAALPSGDRASKFIAMLDAATSAAVTNVQSQIANFAADNIISSIEKRTLQREWAQIQDNKSLSTTLATTLGQTGASQYLAMVAAYDALNTYINTTIDLFADLDSDSSLTVAGSTRSEWDTKWKAWYTNQKTYGDFIASTLDTDIDNVQTDETITKAEAREAELRWQYEVKNHVQHEAVIDSLDASGTINKATDGTWIAYDAAYSALNTYLNTTLDLFNNATWPLLLSTKSSSATQWKSKWQDLTDAERALSQLTNTTFASQIDALADDNIITRGGEKSLANQAWKAIYGSSGLDGEYALLINRANSLIAAGNTSLTSGRDSLTAVFTTLEDYLDNTVPNFYDTTVDSVVVNATWDLNWNNYYDNYSGLDKSTSDIADADIGLISGLVNDEVITAGKEKQQLIELFDQITQEKTAMLTRATIGVGADTTAYVAAYDALQSFLYGLFTGGDSPAFNNKDLGATSVNRSVWKQKFDDYYLARETLQTNIISSNISNLAIDSAAIPNMATDGSITSEEKYVAKTYWNVIFGADALPDDDGEHGSLSAQATALAVTQSYIDNFDDAFTLLWNYLTDNTHGAPTYGGTPIDLFTSMGTPTALDAGQQSGWQSYWSDYYAKRDVLIGQIQTALQADLDAKVNKDGTTTMTGALNMGSNGITNLSQGAGTGQAVEYDQHNDHLVNTTSAHGATGAVVGTTNSQTLTNKTLTTPTIASITNAGTITVPSGTDTLVGRATTDTLTNKTIDGTPGTNTLQNIPITAIASAAITTVIADPGVDTKIPTEQAVREEFDAIQQTIDDAVTTVLSDGVGYACYGSNNEASPSTAHETALMGTRIPNTPSGDWTTAAFALRLSAGFTTNGATGSSYSLKAFIKKESGTEAPYAVIDYDFDYSGSNASTGEHFQISGSISNGSTLTTSSKKYSQTLIGLESVISGSNEISYKLIFTSGSEQFQTVHSYMEGTRAYEGTLLTSGDGTSF